ncbi:MAG: digeranylgeranylglycerophospholipid reductase [Candidatus Methanomethylophilaceae archaeon]|nr:digeranylgeranylglycerophospholipid reductase [Candidatus Methanomethylophilaceae archaeon]
MKDVDVAVVGAGISGTVFCWAMQRIDPDVRIVCIDRLDDRRFDRYHSICGEAVSKQAFKELPFSPRCVCNRIEKVREIWPGDIVIEERAKGYILDRPTFLHDLQDECEEVSFEKRTLRSVRRDGERMVLSTDIEEIVCDVVIGADGAFSTVRRSLFGSSAPVTIPVSQFIVDEVSDSGVIEFVYGERYGGGYRWRFPCGDFSNVGFPHGCDEVPERTLAKGGRHIPIGGVESIVVPGACLLGDAAAMVNPVSFGGIRVAMLSAVKAAEAVAKGDLGVYQRWWDSSGFSDPIFMKAYEVSCRWRDKDMIEFMTPFRHGYRPAAIFRALLGNEKHVTVAKAYMKSFRYGW